MSFSIDPKGILVDALKQSPEYFQLSNLILPNKNSLKAVYKLAEFRASMLDFAKNPEVGMEMLGPPPRKPNTTNMSEEDAEQAEAEYLEMMQTYEQSKIALSMHVPIADMITIDNACEKFTRTLHATSAIKGNRFYAFTKNTEHEEGGPLDFLKNLGGRQQ